MHAGKRSALPPPAEQEFPLAKGGNNTRTRAFFFYEKRMSTPQVTTRRRAAELNDDDDPYGTHRGGDAGDGDGAGRAAPKHYIRNRIVQFSEVLKSIHWTKTHQ